MQQLCNPKSEVKQGPASNIGCCWNSSKQLRIGTISTQLEQCLLFLFLGEIRVFFFFWGGGLTFPNHPIYNSSYADSCRDANSLQKLNDMYESL